MRKKWILMLVLPIIILSSCSAKSNNVAKGYLNMKYTLKRAGDLHGLDPRSNEVLDRNPGFTSYIKLFDTVDSYIDFHCKGTNYDDFHCEASFLLKNADGEILVEKELFLCEYQGSQSGNIVFLDEETKEYLGTIYVYTPYWCRWQFEYDVEGVGEKTLLTFEFWKTAYNELPDFVYKE